MAKYHLRKDGMPGECKATAGNCPLGSDADHFSNKLDALAAAEEKLREENDYLASSKKAQVFHVGANGSVEECKFRDGYCEVEPYGHMANVHSSDRSVVNGAAVGLRAAQAEVVEKSRTSERERRGSAPAPQRKPAPRSPAAPIAEDPITKQARDVLRSGLSSWDQERLDKGWTLEEVQKSRDSCGHWVPPRFQPKPSRGWSC